MTVVWEDPPVRRGAPLSPASAEVLEAIRANPGRWALWPTKTSVGVLRKSHGIEAVCRGGKTYVRTPAPEEAPKLTAVPSSPATSSKHDGKVLMCETCKFTVEPDNAKGLAKHVDQNHARRLSALERTPCRPPASAAV